jgi:hypothetical protein
MVVCICRRLEALGIATAGENQTAQAADEPIPLEAALVVAARRPEDEADAEQRGACQFPFEVLKQGDQQ